MLCVCLFLFNPAFGLQLSLIKLSCTLTELWQIPDITLNSRPTIDSSLINSLRTSFYYGMNLTTMQLAGHATSCWPSPITDTILLSNLYPLGMYSDWFVSQQMMRTLCNINFTYRCLNGSITRAFETQSSKLSSLPVPNYCLRAGTVLHGVTLHAVGLSAGLSVCP